MTGDAFKTWLTGGGTHGGRQSRPSLALLVEKDDHAEPAYGEAWYLHQRFWPAGCEGRPRFELRPGRVSTGAT